MKRIIYAAIPSGEEYDREHCEITREWFEKAPDVTVKYWCEKGYYMK